MVNEMGRHKGIDWSKEKRLGLVRDGLIAKVYGVSIATVVGARQARGIPAYGQPVARELTPVEEGRALELMAKWTTRRVARNMGLPLAQVAKLRKSHGIRPPMPPKPRNRWRPTPDERKMLGKQPDAHLAEELGVKAYDVSWVRRRLGIPSWREVHAPSPNEWLVMQVQTFLGRGFVEAAGIVIYQRGIDTANALSYSPASLTD